MKTLLFTIALALTGCLTEPEVKTRDHTFDCIYITEPDSTITPVCHGERAK